MVPVSLRQFRSWRDGEALGARRVDEGDVGARERGGTTLEMTEAGHALEGAQLPWSEANLYGSPRRDNSQRERKAESTFS